MGERIIGTGIDLVENERIRSMLERWGARFRARLFSESEQTYCDGKATPWLYYAGRFAVKEAVSKAFGTGIGPELGWLDMEVLRHPTSGAPSLRLSPHGQRLADRMAVTRIHISLSHTHHVAVAQALLISATS